MRMLYPECRLPIALIAAIYVFAFCATLLPAADASSCNCGPNESAPALVASDPGAPYPYQVGAQSTTLQSSAQGGFVQGQVEQEGGPVNVLVLIDSSYSMKENLGGGESKMISAKRVLEGTLSRIPPDVNLGLRVFGNGYTGSPEIDCNQSSLLVPIGNGNRRSIIEQVRQLRPYGLTPLTFALMQAERDLRRVQGAKTIILISDGSETCGGNPCEYISRLRALGVRIKVDIVGLGLKRERDARSQLNCIAERSGGKYYDANTAAELAESITHVVNSAISGRVITKMKQPAVNTETQAESGASGSDQQAVPMPQPVVPGQQ